MKAGVAAAAIFVSVLVPDTVCFRCSPACFLALYESVSTLSVLCFLNLHAHAPAHTTPPLWGSTAPTYEVDCAGLPTPAFAPLCCLHDLVDTLCAQLYVYSHTHARTHA